MKNNVIRGITTLSAIILTAALGRIQNGDHIETWYNLRMDKVIERAGSIYGITDAYAVREDGVKTYNGLVICAADWNVYPFGSLVETTLGTGIVLDTHTTQGTVIDIATSWGKRGKK